MRELLSRKRELEAELDRVVGRREQCKTEAERLTVIPDAVKVTGRIRDVEHIIDRQRVMIGELLHSILAEMRFLSRAVKTQQIADLADASAELPRQMYSDDGFSWDVLRGGFERYQRQYHHDSYIGKSDYIQMVDEIRRVA